MQTPAQLLQNPRTDPELMQSSHRALQNPEGFNPPYLPQTPRIAPSCPVLTPILFWFSTFFPTCFLDTQKVTFWSPLESPGYFRTAKIFSGAQKNKNFQSSFAVFPVIRAGKRSRVDFGTKKR